MSLGVVHDPERYWVNQAHRGFLGSLNRMLKPDFLLTRDTDMSLHERFRGLGGFVHAVLELSALNVPVLMGAIVLMQRLVLKHEDLPLTISNIYRVVIAALAIADKLLDDRYMPNRELSAALGVNSSDLHEFELELAEVLEYEILIDRASIMQVARQWGMESYVNIL